MLAEDEGSNEVMDKCLDALREESEETGDALYHTLKGMIGPGGEKVMDSTRKMVKVMLLEYLKRNRVVLPGYTLPHLRA
eukprot:scaffold318_cov269-Pinguiococcus_pyrenoidosus.AAC.3